MKMSSFFRVLFCCSRRQDDDNASALDVQQAAGQPPLASTTTGVDNAAGPSPGNPDGDGLSAPTILTSGRMRAGSSVSSGHSTSSDHGSGAAGGSPVDHEGNQSLKPVKGILKHQTGKSSESKKVTFARLDEYRLYQPGQEEPLLPTAKQRYKGKDKPGSDSEEEPFSDPETQTNTEYNKSIGRENRENQGQVPTELSANTNGFRRLQNIYLAARPPTLRQPEQASGVSESPTQSDESSSSPSPTPASEDKTSL